MMQLVNLKSTYLPQLWGVRTPLRQFASCVLVDSDDTLPSIFSSDMSIGRYVAQRVGIGINVVGFVESTLKFVVEKYSTQELYLSSRNLNQQSDVVHKMVLGVGRLLSISQSGIKRLKTYCSQKQQRNRR